ncbi:hypothetical protein [Streptomyces sp. NPDC054787]
MIGEPELDGAWEAGAPAEPAQDRAPREPVRGRARPWWWAAGGILLASAVWAGVLAAQNRFADASPPLAYRHHEDVCKAVRLDQLGRLAGKKELERGVPKHGESPALDWSYCEYGMLWTEDEVTYRSQVLVELHKKNDPGPEFAAGPGLDPYLSVLGVPVEEVPGLGERALLFAQVSRPRLLVLDGGAVFSLTVESYAPDDAVEPDEDTVKAAMVEDMRALMTALRK